MGAAESKGSMLYDSVRANEINSVISLHSEGADLNWTSFSGKTPLILACSAPHRLHIAKTLLDLGAHVNYYDPEATVGTAIHYAAKRGLEEAVILLLSYGANPLFCNRYSQPKSALDSARERGHTGIVRAIEHKTCLFSGWLRDISPTLPATERGKKIWAVVLPGVYTPARNVLNVALYSDQQSSRPYNVVSLKEYDILDPDFFFSRPGLIFSKKSSVGLDIKLKFLSGIPGDNEQLKLLYNACMGKFQTNHLAQSAPPWPSSPPMAVSAPSAQREEAEISEAIARSMKSAAEEEIARSMASVGSGDIPLVTLGMDSQKTVGEGTSGGSSSCVICNDAPVEAACVPCGHLAGCMSCLTEVKMKDYACPICRAQIESVIKIYIV